MSEPMVEVFIGDELVEVVTELVIGPQGSQGLPGPPGPPGAPGSAPQAYMHVQGSPASDWEITHPLGYNPAGIIVIDSGGSVQEGVVTYTSINTLTISFLSVFGGTAYLS